MKKIYDVTYGDSSACKLDGYFPENKEFSTIVYFHGGGLEAGDKADKNYVEIAESFVKNGYGFISVNYRMYSTGAKFPQFLEDAAQAVAWAKSNIHEYGGDKELYISGQSAGAWISMMLCLNEAYLQAVGVNPLEIKGWIIDSAQMTAHFNVLKYELGCEPNLQRINEYAPLYYVKSDTKFNRMLILFYDEDMPCRAEQNMLFIKAIKHFCKDIDLEYKQLKGLHCLGSCQRDLDGEYAYVKEALSWLR
jgi:dienelactone hydrolase